MCKATQLAQTRKRNADDNKPRFRRSAKEHRAIPLKESAVKINFARKRNHNKGSKRNLDGLYEVLAPCCGSEDWSSNRGSWEQKTEKQGIYMSQFVIAILRSSEHERSEKQSWQNTFVDADDVFWKNWHRLKSWAKPKKLRGSKRAIVKWIIANVTQLAGFHWIDRILLAQCEQECQKSLLILHRPRWIQKLSQSLHDISSTTDPKN